MPKPKKSRTINCKYEGEFNEILENVKFLKLEHSHDELQPDSIAFAIATELENTLSTLVNYKTAGCDRDIQKTQAEKAAHKQANPPSSDAGNLFGFNSRRTPGSTRDPELGIWFRKSRKKSRKKSRRKHRKSPKKSRRKPRRSRKSRRKPRRSRKSRGKSHRKPRRSRK
jgi:hypothetical protein